MSHVGRVTTLSFICNYDAKQHLHVVAPSEDAYADAMVLLV